MFVLAIDMQQAGQDVISDSTRWPRHSRSGYESVMIGMYKHVHITLSFDECQNYYRTLFISFCAACGMLYCVLCYLVLFITVHYVINVACICCLCIITQKRMRTGRQRIKDAHSHTHTLICAQQISYIRV